ncbi:unnamed protein product [Closterium sp. Naga37s-1]|nr:unnamed protein product [Closterium sp. Naga37s-1]CAI5497040.1 unnamed protein product [Closterium sp. Naga37s-1]
MMDATYTSDCMEDQRQFVAAYLAQPFLFNSLPRTPYPDPVTDSHGVTKPATKDFGDSSADSDSSLSPSAAPLPGTLRYFCSLPGQVQALIPQNVTPAGLEEARQAAPPPFIKLDHYNALIELLGGRRSEQYEVQGTGVEIKVYSKVTKAQAAPPPFIKLDHYNALMELLGGRRFEQFEVQGQGAEIKVYSRVTKAFPCIFHQSGDKLKRGVVNEIVENGTLDAIAFEGME